jgi:hypothetical protein
LVGVAPVPFSAGGWQPIIAAREIAQSAINVVRLKIMSLPLVVFALVDDLLNSR